MAMQIPPEGGQGGNVGGVDGEVSMITVSEQGMIEGDVRVDCLVLNGTVVGDVYANDRVELASEARVTGTVYYRMLEMAMGAEVNGQLVHSEEQEPRMLGYDGDKEKPAQTEPEKV